MGAYKFELGMYTFDYGVHAFECGMYAFEVGGGGGGTFESGIYISNWKVIELAMGYCEFGVERVQLEFGMEPNSGFIISKLDLGIRFCN